MKYSIHKTISSAAGDEPSIVVIANQKDISPWSIRLVLFVIAIASFVLLGWQFDIEVFKRPIPQLAAMNPLTALCFITTGVSFLLLSPVSKSTWLHNTGYVLALLPLLAGLIRLSELIVGFQFQIDTILYKETLQAEALNNSLYRMAPNTGFNFILTGMALVLMNYSNRKAKAIANFIVLSIVILSLFSIIGYLNRVDEFYSVLKYIPMSIHTGICFMLLSLAILFTNKQEGFMSSLSSSLSGGVFARIAIPVTIFIPVLFGYLRLYLSWKHPITSEFGVTILVSSIIIFFFSLVWYISVLLNRKDILRKGAEEKITRLNLELEEKVLIRTEEIYRNEKRFRALVENNYDIISLLDESFKIIYRSPSANRITGWTNEELTGADGTKNIHPDDMEKARIIVRDLLANPGKPVSTLFRNQHKNGSYLWLEGTVTNLLHDEQIKAIVFNFRDVTERVEAAGEISKSETRFRNTLDNMLEGAEIIGFDWRYLYVNDAYTKQVKYSKKELLGYTVMEKFPGFEQTGIFKTIVRCFNERVSIHLEDEFTFPDNTKKWFEMSFQPVPEGIFILSVDTTERRKLQEQHALFESLVSSSYDAIISKSLDGIITSWNPGAEKTFGYAATEIIGKHISMLIPHHLQNEEVEIMKKIKKGKDVDHYETERIRKDGKIFYASLTISPIRDSLGNITGASKILRDSTESKEADDKIHKLNEELARSEKRFRGLIENSDDMITMLDSTGKTIYVSPAVVKKFGLTYEECLAMNVADIIHPDDMPVAGAFMTEVMQHPSVAMQCPVIRNVKKDGTFFWVEGTLTNFLETEGINAIVSNFRDVTETRKAEEKIRESEKLYRTIASNIPGSLICLLDADYRYLLIEGDMVEKLGYSKEKLLGNKSIDVLNADMYAQVLPDFKRVFSGETFTTINNQRLEFHTVTRFVPLKDESNKVYAALVVLFDVTELKKAEQLLKFSEGRLRSIIEQFPVPIVTYTPEGVYTGTNKAWEVMWNDKRENIKGYNIRKDPQIISSGLSPSVEKAFKGAVSLSAPYQYDPALIGQAGKKRWMQMLLFPYKNPEGEVLEVILVLQDITFNKEVEQEIKTLNESLEQKVIERTSQFETVNKELEAFSYSVSHDLRAPLRGIVGFTAMLEEKYAGKLDDEARRITGIIMKNTLKMGLLIDDLLAFSRMGKKEVLKTLINTNLMVNEIVEELVLHSKDHNSISWDIRSLPSMNADINTIRQVWINLISNAIKYSGNKESPHIEIGSYSEDGDTVFYIKDNGVGFNEEYKHKLFKVFQRLHDAGDFEGTGVGLAIVEKIVSRHAGKVWADGKEDDGACFYFSLPSQLQKEKNKQNS